MLRVGYCGHFLQGIVEHCWDHVQKVGSSDFCERMGDQWSGNDGMIMLAIVGICHKIVLMADQEYLAKARYCWDGLDITTLIGQS